VGDITLPGIAAPPKRRRISVEEAERLLWAAFEAGYRLNADGDPLSAEEAREFGQAAVRLGLLDRVEVTP
jgi:hypothetical protein